MEIMDPVDQERLRQAFGALRDALLAERSAAGHWTGELSASALATATAVSALAVAGEATDRPRIREALAWLALDQNPDGGWGDSPESPSNLPTTMLVRAAFALAHGEGEYLAISDTAERYIREATGGGTPADWARTLLALYGRDRTFAVPILVNSALAGRVAWEDIPPLPFELACLPHAWLRWLGLEVVSYALPALIAMGQILHARRPARSAFVRALRHHLRGRTLHRLAGIQPRSGGFLEAVPLTAFVCMSLGGLGFTQHEVVRQGLQFLRHQARDDGSWPIDVNLSMWLTTSAVTALAQGGHPPEASTIRWILAGQMRTVHPFTAARPGGWAWTDRPGGVPDVDDTAGAMIALKQARAGAGVDRAGDTVGASLERGAHWLLALQNRDGGWPTFCRGWHRLPFDQSAPDLTAHALRALYGRGSRACAGEPRTAGSAVPCLGSRGDDLVREGFPVHAARTRGLEFLRLSQRPSGAWIPLWFGSQETPDRSNPVVGTSRVLLAYAELELREGVEAQAGIRYLLDAQNADRGWGAAPGVKSTTEETALAVASLTHWYDHDRARHAYRQGALFLARQVEQGLPLVAAPIGLYFARLWYAERLYPLVWSTDAVGRVLTREAWV